MAAKRVLLTLLALIGSGGFLAAQNTGGGGGGGGTANTIKSGTSLPATCTPSANNIFLKTSAPAALYACTATDTWTASTGSTITTGNLTEATSSVLTITGGTSAVVGTGTTIQVKQATDAQSGYLSAADHAAFNGKQAAGNYLTGLTGDVSASGPGSVAATLASVGSAGTCGDATHSCALTFDLKGRETARANTSIIFPGITALTGDATATGPGSTALTLATVNTGPGLCGDSTHVCQITTNGKGLITLQTPVAIAASGSGTVTSVGLTTPSWLTVTGSPVTGAGTLAVTAAGSQAANQFLATPNGVAGAVGLRSIVAADVPTLNQSTTGNAATATALAANPTDCGANTWANAIAANGNLTCTAVTYGQVSGTPTLYNQTLLHDSTAVTQRAKFNLAAGSNMSITATDNGTDTTTFTLASTAGGGNMNITSGAGAPTGNCTAGTSWYLDATNQDDWYCSATNTWKKNLSTTNSGPFVATGGTSSSAPTAPSAGNASLFFTTSSVAQTENSSGAIAGTQVVPESSATSNQWVTYYDNTGTAHRSQPAASNLSNGTTGTGAVALAASPTFTGTTTVNNLTVSGTCTGCGAGGTIPRVIAATFDGGGSALTSGKTLYTTVPFACTIAAWNITADTGTATVKLWKVASGTAIPTAANSINTSGVSLSTGTAIHSTTLTDFTTTSVSANDIVAVNLSAVASATLINVAVQCNE